MCNKTIAADRDHSCIGVNSQSPRALMHVVVEEWFETIFELGLASLRGMTALEKGIDIVGEVGQDIAIVARTHNNLVISKVSDKDVIDAVWTMRIQMPLQILGRSWKVYGETGALGDNGLGGILRLEDAQLVGKSNKVQVVDLRQSCLEEVSMPEEADPG